jgi:hypothetical protein
LVKFFAAFEVMLDFGKSNSVDRYSSLSTVMFGYSINLLYLSNFSFNAVSFACFEGVAWRVINSMDSTYLISRY